MIIMIIYIIYSTLCIDDMICMGMHRDHLLMFQHLRPSQPWHTNLLVTVPDFDCPCDHVREVCHQIMGCSMLNVVKP